jgi:hypothetical protein
MNDVEDKEETSHTITLGKLLASKTRPQKSRTAIKEEIRADILKEVKKVVSPILNEIEDVSIKNRKLRYKNKTTISKNKRLKSENVDENELSKAKNQ